MSWFLLFSFLIRFLQSFSVISRKRRCLSAVDVVESSIDGVAFAEEGVIEANRKWVRGRDSVGLADITDGPAVEQQRKVTWLKRREETGYNFEIISHSGYLFLNWVCQLIESGSISTAQAPQCYNNCFTSLLVYFWCFNQHPWNGWVTIIHYYIHPLFKSLKLPVYVLPIRAFKPP